MTFNDLDLKPEFLEAVTACGFEHPTPIQEKAIPLVLTGGDLMASAPTGTGKTAAFVLPALQHLLNPPRAKGRGPRVLVLTPTRELASQINSDIEKFNRFTQFVFGNVLGGMPYPPQIRLLQQPLDILVATPGRLMDHMRQGRVDFSRLEILVLDEADRMLDMGFINDIRYVASKIPSKRQTLLFSATLEGEVLRVANQLMKDPTQVQLADNKVEHHLIEQTIHHADNLAHKYQLLSHHLTNEELSLALIFTSTKRHADDLADTLKKQGHSTAALHGDMRQRARDKTMRQMRQGQLRLLVATDVASRGLDIKGVSHVINFDLPTDAEDYIHRIGRTGRAGEYGTAISLVGPEDWPRLAGIERLTGRPLIRQVIPGLEPKTNEPRSGYVETGRSWKPAGLKSGGRRLSMRNLRARRNMRTGRR